MASYKWTDAANGAVGPSLTLDIATPKTTVTAMTASGRIDLRAAFATRRVSTLAHTQGTQDRPRRDGSFSCGCRKLLLWCRKLRA
jgi:hypothetical protein